MASPMFELGSDTAICADITYMLDATALDAASYLWSPGNETTPSIIVDSTGIGLGSQEFSVLVTSVNGCETSTSVILTDPALLTVSAAVSSAYNGADISCNGALDGEVTATPAGGTGAYSFEWFEDAALLIPLGTNFGVLAGGLVEIIFLTWVSWL